MILVESVLKFVVDASCVVICSQFWLFHNYNIECVDLVVVYVYLVLFNSLVLGSVE